MSLRVWLRCRPLLITGAVWAFTMWVWVTESNLPILTGAVRALAFALGVAVVWEVLGWFSTKVTRAVFA